MDILQIGSLDLAYLGDAVLELMVRSSLVKAGYSGAGKMSKLSLDYVKATSQSDALEKILPELTESETGVYKRARNNSKISAPKSATVAQYRRATGLEALFAYLYLDGQTERLEYLFDKAFGPFEGPSQ